MAGLCTIPQLYETHYTLQHIKTHYTLQNTQKTLPQKLRRRFFFLNNLRAFSRLYGQLLLSTNSPLNPTELTLQDDLRFNKQNLPLPLRLLKTSTSCLYSSINFSHISWNEDLSDEREEIPSSTVNHLDFIQRRAIRFINNFILENYKIK